LSAERPRSILFAIGSLEIGGAEKQLLVLIRGLQTRFYACHVFTLQPEGPLAHDLNALGVPVFPGGIRKGDLSRAPWKLLPAQWRITKAVCTVKPSVVHSFLPLVSFMGPLAARLMRVPLVVSSRRALGTHQDRHRILRPFDLLANTLSHRVTVNSKAVWKDVIRRDGIDPSKLMLIYNAVDPTPFESARPFREKIRRDLGIQAHQKAIITIANLIPYKGHSDLFKAISLVIKQVPEIKLFLVGEDRGIQGKLRDEGRELGLSRCIRFMGRRNDVPALLAASDLSVVASHEEGFSNVILESMAAGVPVVATDVGGNGEAILDGGTGWLVPPRDPEALADKMIDLMKEPTRANRWGENGRERVRRLFTVEKMVEEHLKLYHSALIR
jgi:glycosyltransferase involved in cell wall biosynthesis